MVKSVLHGRFTPGNDPPLRLRRQGNQRKLGVLTLLWFGGHAANHLMPALRNLMATVFR
jgi:hypothetical protein